MSKTYLIGVDIGTTGTKTGVFDENGVLAAEAYEESKLYYPKPSFVEQDPEEIYGSVIRTIKECLEKGNIDAGSVACISIDSQQAGVSTIDKDWGTPTVYDSWLDSRCGAYLPQLKKNEEKIISLSGGPPTFSHGAKILWWMNEHPEVYKNIFKFVQPGGYVAGRMAGLKAEDAFIDKTYLNYSVFSDTKNGVWSDELLGLYDVDKAKLPRIVDSCDIIGHVNDETARITGLMSGTPIAAGCGDCVASMLGAGMVRPGMVVDVSGTASLFNVCIDRFVTDVKEKTLFTCPHVIPGLYFTEAYIAGGGLNLRWFRDEMVAYEKKESDAIGEDIYERLNQMASKVPLGSEKLLFLPHFSGRTCPNDPHTHGALLGLTWTHTKAHIYRSMLEAVGYEYAYYLDITRKLLPDLEVTAAFNIAGGARSNLWRQIKADILGIPYSNRNKTEFGILGGAIIAGHAVGVFNDIAETAERFVSTTSTIDPDMNAHKQYQPFVKEYQNLLKQTKPIFDSMATF